MKRIAFIIHLTFFTSIASASSFYVLTDGYKVLPSGKVIEFGREPKVSFKEKNFIWDRKKNEIHLAAASNEVLAFQIVIEAPINNLNLTSESLVGPSEISKEAISFHRIGYVSYGSQFLPDIVIPLNQISTTSFSVPYNVPGLPTIENQKVGVVFVEIKIPDHTPPGQYYTRIHLGGDITEIVNLYLQVWGFSLPNEPSIVLDFNSYSSPVKAVTQDQRNPYLPIPSETIRAEHEFYRCANQHRAYLNILPIHSQRGTPRYAPQLRGNGDKVTCDWTYWDKRFGPVLEGTIFEDGVPPPYFYLPFNLHWPWGYTHDQELKDQRLNWRSDKEYARDHTKLITDAYLKEWNAVANEFVTHFAEKGWTKPTFQVYLNHSNKQNANSPWRLDEPYDRWDFQVLSYYAKLVKQSL